ncbi:MAG: polysaccharide deacetylase family protein [Rhodovibrionaceae bacterium]|nr:polysaccharide deacetylase family protein [Rhodovibrionaceae bacterium]
MRGFPAATAIDALRGLALSLAVFWTAGAGFTDPAVAQTSAENGAVVLMYHRVGDSRYPSTNVTIPQFEAHLAELQKDRYHVMPLPEIVAAIDQGRPLPARTVAITFDDAYRSILEHAWPRLEARGLAFTLFVATDPVDRGVSGYLTWDELRMLERHELVTIGSQTATHPHLPLISKTRVETEFAASQARFRAELGTAPTLIAYPYGEYDSQVKALARQAGFTAGFGQHSGVVARASDLFALPRFAFNEDFADMERFALAVNALPLPVTEVVPESPVLSDERNPPHYGFTVDPGIGPPASINCYASGFGKVRTETLGQRVEVRIGQPLPSGRTRVNCTLHAGEGRWRWLGRQFLVP